MLLVDAKPTVAAVFACSCSFCYKNGLLEFHPSASVCVCFFFFVCVFSLCVCVCQCMQCRLRFLRRNGKFRGWSSQRSLHSAPIFRLLLKVAVNGTQCDSHNFWGALSSNKQSVTEDELLQAELGGSAASNSSGCFRKRQRIIFSGVGKLCHVALFSRILCRKHLTHRLHFSSVFTCSSSVGVCYNPIQVISVEIPVALVLWFSIFFVLEANLKVW